MQSINKRLIKELESIKNGKNDGITVVPTEENFHVWNCIIDLKLPSETDYFPVHLVIVFPRTYPLDAPVVGFSVRFNYKLGAISLHRPSQQGDSPLDGKYEICLDMLGNYAAVHGDWKSRPGVGWSPAYQTSSVLLNIQSILYDSLDKSNAKEQLIYKKACLKYMRDNPTQFAESATAASIVQLPALVAVAGKSKNDSVPLPAVVSGSGGVATSTSIAAPTGTAAAVRKDPAPNENDAASTLIAVPLAAQIVATDTAISGGSSVVFVNRPSQQKQHELEVPAGTIEPIAPAAPAPSVQRSFFRRLFTCRVTEK
jgi:ubiquitin-protein ligase